MKKKLCKLGTLLIIFTMLLTLTSCIPGDGTYNSVRPAGFFWGIWHGWVSPISLIISLFDHNIRVYEVNNTGWWYDFGFYMAIISGFGGLSQSRKHKKCKDK
jgi:hypothetical protein